MSVESFYSTLLFIALYLVFHVVANCHDAVASAAREAIMAAARCFMLIAQPRRDNPALTLRDSAMRIPLREGGVEAWRTGE